MAFQSEIDHWATTKPSIFSCRPTKWYTKFVKRTEDAKPPKPAPQIRNLFTLKEQLWPPSTREPQLPPTSHDLSSKIPNDQPQSSLCSRLPREIRLEIFRYVLGGRYFHLRYGDGKVRPYICRYPCIQRSDGHDCSHARCWDQYYPPWKKHQLSMALSSNLLPLLQTCSYV